MTPQITGRSWASILLLGFVWGGTFIVIEVALRGITPFWLAAGRIAFAALLTTVIWRIRGGRLFDGPVPWGALVAVGALSSAFPFIAISWGQQFVTAGFTGVSMASVALIVLPLAHFLVPGEALTRRKTLGFVVGFVGVVILIGPGAFRPSGIEGEHWGQLACLAAAACYATSSIAMRRLPPVDTVGLSAMLLLIGSVIVVVAALVVEGPPPPVDGQTLGIVALLGLIPTAAAGLLRVLVIRTAGPVFLSLVNYQVPIWSVVLGVILLDEPLEPSLFAAMALILAGVALSQARALRSLFLR